MVSWVLASNAYAQFCLGYRYAFLPEASSRSLLHVREQQMLWRDCAYGREPLPVAYMISSLFSCAGSNNEKRIHLAKFWPFKQVDNFCGFLFVFLYTKPLQKRGLP